MAVLLLSKFGFKEVRAGPHFIGRNSCSDFVHKSSGALNHPGFHQARDYGNVFSGSLLAFLQIAHTVANVQANIPK